MEAISNDTIQPEQATERQGFVCSGDCLRCSQQQRLYCAAQHGQQVFRLISTIAARLDVIETALDNIQRSQESVLSAEDNVFNPLDDTETTTV